MADDIRRLAHRLAAEGVLASLNEWDLGLYCPDEKDQDELEIELVAIARRLQRRGGEQ